MKWLLFVGVLALGGCGGPRPHTKEAGVVNALVVHQVAWNGASAHVGNVSAVADVGDVAAVFTDDGAYVFAAGALVASDTSTKSWVDAETILGPDGTGRWIVGVDGRGRIFHLRGRTAFEDVSERYGLGDRKVKGAATLGTSVVGFLLDGEVAVADGTRVVRYAAPALVDLYGGGGHGVAMGKDKIVVFGTTAPASFESYVLPGVTAVAMGPDGRLYATTPRGVYGANVARTLELLYESSGASIHGLVASGEHVWFADGTELGIIDGTHVAETSGASIAPDARLLASTTGDVWVVAKGKLGRYSRSGAEPEVARAWASSLSGVFARACASCHQADGPAGFDLSSAEAWHEARSLILQRVVKSRTMPPQGHSLSDADRELVRAWAEAR